MTSPLPALLAPLIFAAPQDVSGQDSLEALSKVERVTPVVLIARAVRPAVVYIETESTQRVRSLWGVQDRVYSGSGSGVVIHPDGYIVTNFHVVKGARSITVSFARDPRTYTAELVSSVQAEDLALLKIASPNDAEGQPMRTFHTVRMGTSADLMEGERVVAIGNPHGQTHTVSTGIISGLHRNVPVADQDLHFKDLIQTDASINFGNSGGPLLNIRGELIGINSAMNSAAENIGFAIPVDRMREILTDVLFPEARKSWLGFNLEDGTPLRIAHVWPGSPADVAGICAGDILQKLGERKVESQEDFLHASLELIPGEVVPVQVSKPDGDQNTLPILAWDRYDGTLFERMGLTVREAQVNSRIWVLVQEVIPDGPAEHVGIRAGDLIPAVETVIDGMRYPVWIRSRGTLVQLISGLEPGHILKLDVYRDDDKNRKLSRDELYEGTLTLR
ncbi:MAG TPA: trypsin-like peptidase domain-containing protein [Planctomycetota bacterium]|jgi:serine protease Do|nr:trypsin-like peptidase domain-containing protein [Planctomycetota bacterium]